MFDSFDQASLDLIIELQLQDAQNLIKGKHKAGETPDGELAAELFKLELESLASFHVDQAMSRSIAHAAVTDGEVIRSLVAEEQQAERDRELAINGEASTHGPGTAAPDTAIEDDMVKKLVALYVGEDGRSGTAAASSSKRAARPSTSTAAIEKRRCVACMTDVPYFETVRCPCTHEYCRACIADLFQSAINDESLFPPRCCSQPIPLGLNQIFLPARLAGQYRAKELEYSTKNRTYCHRATCSTFIPAPFIRGEIATCIKCQSKTCTICKGSSHDGDCPEDVATMDLLNVAAQNGWQRCYSCRRMVDLEVGCNHITCRCGAQFCYVCGVKWKNCSCDQWDEHRLIDRANAIVDRDADILHIEGVNRAALVEQERNNLVANHDCWNHRWKSRRGHFQCEECFDYMPEFIYECRDCRLMACRRCRYNRL
ncbi:hypothetical protein J3458_000086 [Metarhizium acridum]|uniref:uncharacterized protein n=1 Tax=Metarhizium acridum TaxID=92637 RepID=UPI001C6CF7CF|nr:hypothetical protein J3458_000086 [Metarhizium acridum]